MTVRILDEHDVRRLLPMDECIDAMAEALAALARGELHNPLRFVVRPPGEASLMGLMPAHRGGESPLYALKTVAISPGNSARGLDSHQGFVALFDGETGETRALVNAGAITAIRTAAVSGVATRLLARDDARTLAILGAGIQAQVAPRRDARRARLRPHRRLEPHARARIDGDRGGGHGRGGRARRRRRRHRDLRRGADRRARAG